MYDKIMCNQFAVWPKFALLKGIIIGGLFLPSEPPKSVTYVEFMKMCILHYTNLPKFAQLKENILGGLFLPSEPPKSVTYSNAAQEESRLKASFRGGQVVFAKIEWCFFTAIFCAIYLPIEKIMEVDFFFPLTHLKMWLMARLSKSPY